MNTSQIIFLVVMAFAALANAGDTPDEDEVESDAECYPAFDKSFKEEFFKAAQDCQYKPMKNIKKSEKEQLQKFRSIQNPFRKVRVESVKVRTEQECHFICYTFPQCKSFRFEPLPLKTGCNPGWEDCNPSKCDLLTEKVELNAKDSVDEDYIYGERDLCTESMSHEAKDYFSSPDSRYAAAKADFLVAKDEYDVENKESVHHYSYLATNCLGPIIEQGEISEGEMGIAQSVIAGRIPYMPEGNPEQFSKKVSITVRDAGTWKYNRFWVFTGLYALPGKFVTVKTPDMALSQVIIKIGSHKDPLYRRGNPANSRDPQVTMDFNITSSSQVIGSVYGGLIIVNLGAAHALTGQTFEIEFDNVIEAPLFNLDTDTNDDWNNHIKNKPAPWTVFRIPEKITFVLDAAHVKQITDVTTNLKEWEAFMVDLDYAACVIDRKKGEIIVPDILVGAGLAHSGYPIGTMLGTVLRGESIFPKGGTINNPSQALGLGHEIGHNVSPLEAVSHVAINMFNYYALPKTRLNSKGGVWGRKDRLFAYISAGKPDILDRDNYAVMSDIIKLPMDGPDGLGWENEGNWDDLHKISCLWNEEGPKDGESVYDRWAKTVCRATERNMIEYFKFWNYKLTENTEDVCRQYAKEPTNMMSWIGEIADLVDESAASCHNLEGWYGHHGKCYIFSSKKMKLEEAAPYCEDLGGELGTIENEKDAILVNYARNKNDGKIVGAWLGHVSAPAEVYPYADKYDPAAEGQWELETKSYCSFGVKIDMNGGTGCMAPVISEKGKRAKQKTLCQMVMA